MRGILAYWEYISDLPAQEQIRLLNVYYRKYGDGEPTGATKPVRPKKPIAPVSAGAEVEVPVEAAA